MRSIRPPILLNSKEFDRHYRDSREVYNANDLSHIQIPGIPCINISVLAAVATNVAKLASEGSVSTNAIATTSISASNGGSGALTEEDGGPQYSLSMPPSSDRTSSRESRSKKSIEIYTESNESSKESPRTDEIIKPNTISQLPDSSNNENSDINLYTNVQ